MGFALASMISLHAVIVHCGTLRDVPLFVPPRVLPHAAHRWCNETRQARPQGEDLCAGRSYHTITDGPRRTGCGRNPPRLIRRGMKQHSRHRRFTYRQRTAGPKTGTRRRTHRHSNVRVHGCMPGCGARSAAPGGDGSAGGGRAPRTRRSPCSIRRVNKIIARATLPSQWRLVVRQ
jgi:hypothetical protein